MLSIKLNTLMMQALICLFALLLSHPSVAFEHSKSNFIQSEDFVSLETTVTPVNELLSEEEKLNLFNKLQALKESSLREGKNDKLMSFSRILFFLKAGKHSQSRTLINDISSIFSELGTSQEANSLLLIVFKYLIPATKGMGKGENSPLAVKRICKMHYGQDKRDFGNKPTVCTAFHSTVLGSVKKDTWQKALTNIKITMCLNHYLDRTDYEICCTDDKNNPIFRNFGR